MIEIIKNWYKKYGTDPQVVILFVFLLAGFVLVATIGKMLAPVIAAIVIAYILEGLISGLERFRVTRNIALVAVFSLFVAALLSFFIFLLPMLSKQFVTMLQELPMLLANGQKQLMQLPGRYPEIISQQQVSQFVNFLKTEITLLGQYILSISLASVRGIITLVVYLVLVPLLVFFFLKDKQGIIEWFKRLLPANTGLASEVWQDVNRQIANYMRGKIWEIAIVWTASYLLFTFLGLKFTALISLAVGLSVIAPYIGATVMFFPVALVAFFQWGFSPEFTWLVVSYLVLQALDGNLLAPLLLSGVVNLHPVATIVALLIFGGIWGAWGLFFAIPLATLVHSVLKTWIRYIKARKASEENSALSTIPGQRNE